MSDVTIFKQKGAVSTTAHRGISELGKSLASSATSRRIQTSTNGTFRRIINGEQVGNAVRGEINVIIVGALPKVSRIYYAAKFDPDAEPTLPDCWSNLGDRPETPAKNKQSENCLDCKQNTRGSAPGDRKACRYQRRISVMLEGDTSGEIYQFNIPSKSLFGKGTGNTHPFESYVKYLINNNESPDTVVTTISYDLNAETMELLFAPLRGVTDDEAAVVAAAQDKPEARMYTMITVAQTDGVKKQAPAVEAKAPPAPKVVRSDEPDDELAEPVKRGRKPAAEATPKPKQDLAAVIDAWGEDDK